MQIILTGGRFDLRDGGAVDGDGLPKRQIPPSLFESVADWEGGKYICYFENFETELINPNPNSTNKARCTKSYSC